jgi:hypothetical protein
MRASCCRFVTYTRVLDRWISTFSCSMLRSKMCSNTIYFLLQEGKQAAAENVNRPNQRGSRMVALMNAVIDQALLANPNLIRDGAIVIIDRIYSIF